MQESRPVEIEGVSSVPLSPKGDKRGWLVEAWRPELAQIDAIQVNVMKSVAGSLRGCHVHLEHTDWFFVPAGRAVIALHDVRPRSRSFAKTAFLELDAESPAGLLVPAGVVHAVAFPVDSFLVTIESMRYDPEEEIHTLWRDPAYGFVERLAPIVALESAAVGFSRTDLLARLYDLGKCEW